MVEFDAILAAIEGKVQILETVNDKILSQTDADGIEEETLQTDEYFMDLEIELCRLRAFPGQHSESISTHGEGLGNSGTSEQQRNNIHPGRTVSSFSSSSNSANSAQLYRLPKISLPSFSGDILQWQSFWDSYSHSNANLTDVQK